MRRHLAVLIVAVILAGCTSQSAPPSSDAPDAIGLAAAAVPRASSSATDAAAAATSIDAFGIDIYRRLAATNSNLVLSPASIAVALSMARAGARGETASQMDAVLHLAASAGTSGMNSLDQALASRNGTFKDELGNDMTVALHVANAPFAQRGERWETSFLQTLASQFGAGLRLVDYRGNPEAARQLINAWVNEKTEKKIPTLLAPGVIDSSTRLTLVNAIYLKAPWALPFSADATKPAPFHLPDGSTVEVPAMALMHSFGYAEGTGWKAVEIPYIGGSLAMDIVLPDDLASFEKTLTPVLLASVTGGFESRGVSLHLPRFRVRTQAGLNDALAALGMPLAFDPGSADFSGMTTQERLFISAVVHEATIDVDEKGTEASAATAVAMAASAALETVDFRVDRPFLFALRDVPTGAILFLGRVADPAAGS